jgi:dihydroorotate dehydrogenase electron transfer subunit
MKIFGYIENLPVPGQFINIKIENFFLRRPFSICNFKEDTISIIYKIVGKGTKSLSKMKPNKSLNVLYPLGNGFDLNDVEKRGKIILVGGGVGIPPLYFLAKELKKLKINFEVVLGFTTYEESFFVKEFLDISKLHVASIDGKIGKKGLVTDILKEISHDYYFTCGPLAMLKAVHKIGKEGQLSLEERMGCGFGACMGCSLRTSTKVKRVCAEGPIFKSSEVVF